jgi:hypothetical protein
MGRIVGLTDESVCPTVLSKDFQPCGAGAFACQPFFALSQGAVRRGVI